MKNSSGFTLLEILVVIAVLGILLGIAAISGHDWLERYRVENQTRELYVDLMNTRVRAMQENRIYFVSLPDIPEENTYEIYMDTNPFPDGDGTLQIASDQLVMSKTTRFPIRPHMGFGSRIFQFKQTGLVNLNGRLQVASSVNPHSDCIIIFSTRILIGKWDESTSTCVAQ